MNNEVDTAYNELIRRFITWATSRDDVRAAFIVGSRARTDHPADEWSDLDLVIVTRDPEYILFSSEWLHEIGQAWISFIERTAVGEGYERRVLFEPGLDVDFSAIAEEEAGRLIEVPEVEAVLYRGIRVLLDKDSRMAGLQNSLSQKPRDSVDSGADTCLLSSHSSTGEAPNMDPSFLLRHRPSLENSPSGSSPAEREFVNLVNDFWYHTVWITKKLLRGELWTAVSCLNCYMHRKVLRMLEYHAKAVNGVDSDIWYNGRFVEEWADKRALEGLRRTFAHYDAGDARRSLLSIMDLFRWLAMETGQKLGFRYPSFEDQRATEWVKYHLIESDGRTI